jgi:hypothetical protein
VRWGTHFADFDNDGWPDLYAVGGHLAPRMVRLMGHYKSGYAAYVDAGDRAFAQRSVLLHNRGAGRYEEWGDAGDLTRLRMAARGTAVGDLDGDGALDLVIVDIDGPVRILRNELSTQNGWIDIEPRTGADAKTAIGARVRVTSGGRAQTQTLRVTPSYASGSLLPLHFGLGPADVADVVEVRWPSGKVQVFERVPGRRTYRVPPDGPLEPVGVGSGPARPR